MPPNSLSGSRDPSSSHLSFAVVTLGLVAVNFRTAVASLSPLLSIIERALHMSSATAALLTTLPLICMGIFAPLAPLLDTRLGIGRTMTICLLLIGVGLVLRMESSTIAVLLATAVIAGLGMAISGPLVSMFIKQWFPAGQAGLMTGVYVLAMGVGSALSSGTVVILYDRMNGNWQHALAIWVVLVMLGLVAWGVFKRHLPEPIHPSTQTPSRIATLPWTNRRLWLLTIVFGIQGGLFYSLTTWLAPLAEQMGATTGVASEIATVAILIQTACNFLIPTIVGRIGHLVWWMVGGSSILAIGLLGLTYGYHTLTPWIAVSIIGIGIGGLFPLCLLMPIYEVDSPQRVNEWTSVMLCGGYLIASLVPLMVGALRDALGSFSVAFTLLAILSGFLAILSYVTHATRPVTVDHE